MLKDLFIMEDTTLALTVNNEIEDMEVDMVLEGKTWRNIGETNAQKRI